MLEKELEPNTPFSCSSEPGEETPASSHRPSGEKKSAAIHVGTSGYAFPSWRGRGYPPDLSERRMLEHYAFELGFDAVELNFSFYHMPAERTIQSIARRVPDTFRIAVKAPWTITHAPTQSGWRPSEETAAFLSQFDAALQPIFESGQYVGSLFQFPHRFRNTERNRAFLAWVRERLPRHRMIVEFRHRSWDHETVFRFLREHRINFCVVDVPDLPTLMPLRLRVTGDTFYWRLHGRNRMWFRDPTRRYDYSYSEDELRRFARWIVAIPGEGDRFIFFNNCHAGAALRNAQMLKKLVAASAVH